MTPKLHKQPDIAKLANKIEEIAKRSWNGSDARAIQEAAAILRASLQPATAQSSEDLERARSVIIGPHSSAGSADGPWRIKVGYKGSGPWDRTTIEAGDLVIATVNTLMKGGEAEASARLLVERANTTFHPAQSEREPETVTTVHYLTAILERLNSLYELLPDDPRLREHISDEIDWVEAEIERLTEGK